jgi:hypothetical protein
MQTKPRKVTAHSKQAADEYQRLGWTLRSEFRRPVDDEPCEYYLEWSRDDEPVRIDWNKFTHQVTPLPHPTSFEQKVMPHLEALAAILLAQKMFYRLNRVTSLLFMFYSGLWRGFSERDRATYVEALSNDFHRREWDDWDPQHAALSTIRELFDAELKTTSRAGSDRV